ncbi:MAG: hypothetical protein K0B09_00055 [Bacteroidales bacterium]|nr:hypothetical protein [Bacteroidales bacterium]
MHQEIKDRIIHLLEEIVERAHAINQQTSQHTDLEIDLVMEDLRLLYREFDILRRRQQSTFEKPEAQARQAAPVVETPKFEPEPEVPAEEQPVEKPLEEADAEISAEATPETHPETQTPAEPETESEPEPESAVEPTSLKPEPQPEPDPVEHSEPKAHKKPEVSNGPRSLFDLFSAQTTGSSVGERLASEDNSLHKRIVAQKEDRSIGARLQMTPVSNLKDAIGVNEKFLFINELFGGNIQVYNESVARLNEFGNMHEAFDYLNELNDLLGWDEKRSAQTIEKLANFVQRRYMER